MSRKAGGPRSSSWGIVVSAVLVLGLAGAVFHFQSRAASIRREFGLAGRDLEEMKKTRLQYRALESKKQNIPNVTKVNPQDYESYLSKKAFVEAGLSKADQWGTTPPRDPKVVGKWKEFPYIFTQTASPNQVIARDKFIRFLELVETGAPTFKSKNLTLRFARDASPSNLSSVMVTFSHFEKQP